MKAFKRLKKTLIIALAMSTTVSTVYAIPHGTTAAHSRTGFSTLPTITLEDITLEKDTLYNMYTGVTAVDQYGNDITHTLTTAGGFVDTTEPGHYQLVFKATDSQGLTGLARRNVYVVDSSVVQRATPRICGVEDVTIQLSVNDFNILEGVSAVDAVDGDLTSKIRTMNYIQSGQTGTFVVQYTVYNSEGLRSMHNRFVTVNSAQSFDANKQYSTGDEVSYQGYTYVAQWWTRGEIPGRSDAWKLKEAGSITNYIPGKQYVTGERVRYEGIVYEAQWWTLSVPGTDNSWARVQ